MAVLGLGLLQSCAPRAIQSLPPPLGREEISHIISSFRDQEERVHGFISSGRLILEHKGSESESNILMLGTRDPYKIKIEITHPWGRPLLHILIQKTSLHILSFSEKRLYLGHMGTSAPLNLLPGRLDPDQVWSLARGYPVLGNYQYANSSKLDQITLLNGKTKIVQVIDLYPQENLPHQISFPEQGIKVSFSDFENENGIYYAEKITLDDPEAEAILVLDRKQMVFNKSIPEAAFALEIPPDFAVLPLREGLEE